MKKSFSLNEYVASISINDLERLAAYLFDKYPGDLAFCLEYFSKNDILDNMLSNTTNSYEIYDILDNMFLLLSARLNKIREKDTSGSK
jgi:hypothetical protein